MPTFPSPTCGRGDRGEGQGFVPPIVGSLLGELQSEWCDQWPGFAFPSPVKILGKGRTCTTEDAVDHLGLSDKGNDAHGLPALDMMLSKQSY